MKWFNKIVLWMVLLLSMLVSMERGPVLVFQSGTQEPTPEAFRSETRESAPEAFQIGMQESASEAFQGETQEPPLRFSGSETQEPTPYSTWADLQEAVNRAENNDVIALDGNITAGAGDKVLVIPEGVSLTLDLNGFTLDRAAEEGGSTFDTAVLSVSESSCLTICDSSGGRGIITGGSATLGGGIMNRGTLILEGGCITGNRALNYGGGIVNNGILLLRGGLVTGNTAGVQGGGVFNSMLANMWAQEDIVVENSAPKDSEIGNDGTITIIGKRPERIIAIHDYIEIVSAAPVLALLLALTFAVRIDSYLSRKQKRTLYIIVLMIFGLIAQGFLEYRLSLPLTRSPIRTGVAIFGYALRPMILVMFLYIIQPDRRYRAVWVLIGLNTAVYLTGFFSHLPFFISGNNHFHEGPLYPTCMIVSGILFVYLLWLTIQGFHPRRQKETWILLFPVLLVLVSILLDKTVIYSEQPVAFTTIAIVISSMLYYIWLHLQFVRIHEKDLQAEQRIQIMMTQIQPHFLYNTLMTIQALCRKNPDMAYETTEKFGLYLRQNLAVMNQPNLIPLRKELEHTKVYADIEMIRFPNIHIQYEIEDDAFKIPPLTIQPLVENAIRHGVRIREEGIVTVTTRRTEQYHEIEIRDNGIGFDPDKVRTDGHRHIGIQNVRERIEKMCGGTLTLVSRAGEGTVVVMRIP